MTFSKLGTDTQTGQIVELPKTSRLQGLYIIGIQGTGKSGLIENLIMQDIKQQIGVCVLDPHGELIDHVIARLEPKNEKDVILLDINDYKYPFGLNLFECPDITNPLEVQKTVDQVRHIFEKLLGVSTDTPLILEYLYNCTYTLVANPGYTMADIPMLLQDGQCRKKLVANVTDIDVLGFWRQHDQKKPSDQNNDISSTLRRVKQFLQPLSRPIVGQANTTIDLQKIMNDGKILLVKLSTQVDSVSSLIGSLMVALLLNAAYNRPAQRRQFHLYADEFQRFATEDFATLLEEARKFGIGTTIAHQNRSQLDAENKQLETNLKDRSRSVGNLVVFKINSKDADDLAGEFDTSPPPAKPEEIGIEEVRTPVKDVVHHLLNSGSHPNPIVNQFAYGTLTKMQPRNSRNAFEIDALNTLNSFLYKAMIGIDITQFVLEDEWLKLIELPPYVIGCGNYIYSLSLGRPDATIYLPDQKTKIYEPARLAMQLLWKSSASSLEYQQATHTLDNCYRIIFREMMLVRLRDQMHYAVTYLYQGILDREGYGLELHTSWYDIDPHQIQYQIVGKVFKSNRELLHLTGEDTYGASVPEVIPGQEAKCYRETDLLTEIEAKMQPEKSTFLNFLQELKSVMQALAKDPIMIGSGQWIKKTRPGTVRPYQDVKNDIANQLSGLPPFTARVKIGGNAPQNPGKTCMNCGLLNYSGNKFCGGCSAQLPAPNEYTIQTLVPGQGIGKTALQQRLASIQTNNIRDGYVKKREEVEKEIAQRQTSCSGSPPAQPPLPQQPPRHARQVPIQGNCPNCGFSNNPTGAKFCSNCGRTL